YTIAAAVVGGVLAIGLAWIWFALNSLDGEIAQLTTDLGKVTTEAKDKAQPVLEKQRQIDLWLGGEINWLDELARLATKAPSAPEMMLTSLHVPFHELSKPSVMQLSALLKDSGMQKTLISKLSDDRHPITPKPSGESDKLARYKWQVSADIEVKP